MKVDVNRTEALDASRAAIRNEELILPRRTPIIEEFARHMTDDAKILDEKTKGHASRNTGTFGPVRTTTRWPLPTPGWACRRFGSPS